MMAYFINKKYISRVGNYLESYFKRKCADCYLYSEDGAQFKTHKELFGQTDFLRKILSSAKDHCCGILEIICPCTKQELSHLVTFLYRYVQPKPRKSHFLIKIGLLLTHINHPKSAVTHFFFTA